MKNIILSILTVFALVTTTAAGPPPSPPPSGSSVQLDTTNFDNNLSSDENTVQKALEALDESAGTGAPTGASYITTENEAGLTGEANLGALSTGLLKITVNAGVATPSTGTCVDLDTTDCGAITSSGTIEGATLTEGATGVYNINESDAVYAKSGETTLDSENANCFPTFNGTDGKDLECKLVPFGAGLGSSRALQMDNTGVMSGMIRVQDGHHAYDGNGLQGTPQHSGPGIYWDNYTNEYGTGTAKADIGFMKDGDGWIKLISNRQSGTKLAKWAWGSSTPSQCTAENVPFDCCTGSGAGATCDQDVFFYQSSFAQGPRIMGIAAASGFPVFVPNKGDPNTGYGWSASDTLEFVAGGLQVLTINSAGVVQTPVLPFDISDNTNLTAGTGITLTDDTVSVTDLYITNNADDDTGGNLTFVDEKGPRWGSSADYGSFFDASEGILNIGTALTDAVGTPDDDLGLFTIAVDIGNAGMDADQEVFEIGKGGLNDTDPNYVPLLELDEDGDLYIAGTLSVSTGDGVSLTGSNGSVTFAGTGDGQDEDFKIDLNGTANTAVITSPTSLLDTFYFNGITLKTDSPAIGTYIATPPTHSNDSCVKGQYSADSSYFYVCGANNSWKLVDYSTDTLPTTTLGTTTTTTTLAPTTTTTMAPTTTTTGPTTTTTTTSTTTTTGPTTTTTTIPGDSCTGGLLMAWHMEDADLAVDPGCSILGDTTWTANAGQTPVLTTNDQSDGAQSLYGANNLDFYYLDTTQNSPLTEGTLWFDIRPEAATTSIGYIVLQYDIDNRIFCNTPGTSGAIDIKCNYTISGANDDIRFDLNADEANDNWYRVKYEWKTDAVGNDHRITVWLLDSSNPRQTTGSPTPVAETDNMATIASEFVTLSVGTVASSPYESWIDKIKLYNTSDLE